MQYFVIWPNGQRFGPADAQTLRQWLTENRIDGNSELEEVGTGRRLRASDILSATTTTATPPVNGPQDPMFSGYYRPVASGSYAPPNPRRASGEVTLSVILGILGLFLGACCPLFSVVGLILGIIGNSKRQPGAIAAMILNAIGLAIYLGLMTIGSFFG